MANIFPDSHTIKISIKNLIQILITKYQAFFSRLLREMRIGELIQFKYKVWIQKAVIEEIDWVNKMVQVAWWENPYKVVKVIEFDQVIK